MKLGAVLILALAYLFSPAESFIGETDVIRVFDPEVKLPRPEMRALLAKADLVSAGFTKSEETQIVTGEDGKKQKKLVISYTVQDACSNVTFWEETLRARLPIFSKRITRKVIDEVEERIGNHATEYCRFGIEIHFDPCNHAEIEKEKANRSRRSMVSRMLQLRDVSGSCSSCCCCCGTCCCCKSCGKTQIKYTQTTQNSKGDATRK